MHSTGCGDAIGLVAYYPFNQGMQAAITQTLLLLMTLHQTTTMARLTILH
jgi:hypothetical protein